MFAPWAFSRRTAQRPSPRTGLTILTSCLIAFLFSRRNATRSSARPAPGNRRPNLWQQPPKERRRPKSISAQKAQQLARSPTSTLPRHQRSPCHTWPAKPRRAHSAQPCHCTCSAPPCHTRQGGTCSAPPCHCQGVTPAPNPATTPEKGPRSAQPCPDPPGPLRAQPCHWPAKCCQGTTPGPQLWCHHTRPTARLLCTAHWTSAGPPPSNKPWLRARCSGRVV